MVEVDGGDLVLQVAVPFAENPTRAGLAFFLVRDSEAAFLAGGNGDSSFSFRSKPLVRRCRSRIDPLRRTFATQEDGRPLHAAPLGAAERFAAWLRPTRPTRAALDGRRSA